MNFSALRETASALMFDAATSSTFWTAIQAIGTIAAFFVVMRQLAKMQQQTAILQATAQATQDAAEATRATTAYDLLFRIDDRPDTRLSRQKERDCDRALREALKIPAGLSRTRLWETNRNKVAAHIDQFEMIGLLVHRKVIDAEAAWSLFGYSVTNYHAYCQKTGFFDSIRANDSSFYEEFGFLYEAVQAVQQNRTGMHDEPDPDFLGRTSWWRR